MVFVDDMYKSPMGKFRKMKMSHMIADSRIELINFIHQLGLNPKWIQYPGTYREHYDICKSFRKKAIKNGAFEISMKELSNKIENRKNTYGVKEQ